MRFSLIEDKTVKAWFYEKYVPLSFFNYPVTVVDSTMILGKWTIEADVYSNNDTASLYKNKLILQFDFEGNKSYLVDLDITEQNSALILWSYIGDPDHLYYQEYKKR